MEEASLRISCRVSPEKRGSCANTREEEGQEEGGRGREGGGGRGGGGGGRDGESLLPRAVPAAPAGGARVGGDVPRGGHEPLRRVRGARGPVLSDPQLPRAGGVEVVDWALFIHLLLNAATTLY